MINNYLQQGDYDTANALIPSHSALAQAYENAYYQVTPAVESAYNTALAVYQQYGGSGTGGDPVIAPTFEKVTQVSQIADDNISTCTQTEAKAWIKANWNDIMSNAGNGQYASFGFLYHHANGELYHLGFPKNIEDYDFDNMVGDQFVSLTPVGDGEGLSLSIIIDWYQNDSDNYTLYICTGSGSGSVSAFDGNYPTPNNTYINSGGNPLRVTVADLSVGDVLVSSPTGHMEVEKGDCTIVLAGGTTGRGDPLMGELMDVYDDDATLNGIVNFDFNGEFGYARIVDMSNDYKDYHAVYNNSLANSFMVVGKKGNTVILAGYQCTIYTITWQNWDGSALSDGNSVVAEGAVPSYTHEVYRSSDAQYYYTFSGWKDSSGNFYPAGTDLPAVTKDETYKAQYSTSIRTHTIVWKDGNGKTLKAEAVEYGKTPSYTGATPTKADDALYTYEFNGTWSPSIVPAASMATYTAQFNAIPKSFTVTWMNGDDVLEVDESVDANTAPSYDSPAPEKAADNDYTYEFSGWTDGTNNYSLSDTLPVVTGNVTYTAIFTAVPKPVIYKVTWNDWDGTELGYTDVEEGEAPVAPYEGLTRDEDDENTYTFTGWTDGNGNFYADGTALPAVTADITYTATFTAIPKAVEVTINEDGYYCENGEIVPNKGLVKIGDDYYYVIYNGKIKKNGDRTVTEEKANGLLPAGDYHFGTDGKMTDVPVINGVDENGYYRENYQIMPNKGLVQVDGDYYYVIYNGKVKKDGDRTVTEEFTNGLLPAGTYHFGADGKMTNVPLENGVDENGYYRENYQIMPNKGLVQVDGDYYYVIYNGKIKKDGDRTVVDDKTNGLLPAGTYHFGADGKMTNVPVENGIDSDGYYRENYQIMPNKGLVQVDGDYYVIYNGKIKKNGLRTVTAEMANDLLPAGDYYFGPDGKMTDEPAPEPEPAELFTKITDVNQITEDNIGESTFAEAKAWVLDNWDDVKNNDNIVDVVYFVGTDLKTICLYPNMSKQDFEEQAIEESPSINDLQFWVTTYGDDVYLCSKAS